MVCDNDTRGVDDDDVIVSGMAWGSGGDLVDIYLQQRRSRPHAGQHAISSGDVRKGIAEEQWPQ